MEPADAKVKDAPQRRNKYDQITYIAALITMVNYLDDTGMEHHADRVILATEYEKALREFCDTIGAEHA